MTAQITEANGPRLADTVRRCIAAETARRGWTQIEFARRFGIHRAGMSERFRGVKPWTLDETQRAAEILGVPLGTLLFEPEPMEWAPRGSNPQPMDYGSEQLATVLEFPIGRAA